MMHVLEQNPDLRAANDTRVKILSQYGKDVGGRFVFRDQTGLERFTSEYAPIAATEIEFDAAPLPADFLDRVSAAEEAGGPALLTGEEFRAIELFIKKEA